MALALSAAAPAFAQAKLKADGIKALQPIEELVYEATFSRALLRNIDVAVFHFTATRKHLSQKRGASPVLDEANADYELVLTGNVSSKGFFARLFNINFRQQVESTVEPKSFSVQRTLRVDEQGKRVRESEAVFDHDARKVFWIERDPNDLSREPRTETSVFTVPVQDILSAIYFVRTQPLAVGKTLEITISDSGRVYKLPVRVIEKKRMKTVLGRVEALRIDPELFGSEGMIPHQGQLSVWFTNDHRRIPIRARLKSEHGTFDIKLKQVVQNSNLTEFITKRQ